MHGIEDRLRALAAEPPLEPPAASRQATLDAMAAAARAANPGSETASESAQSGFAQPGPAHTRSGVSLVGSAWARAAVWVAVIGVAVTAGAIALRHPSSDSVSGELTVRTPGPATDDAGMAGEAVGPGGGEVSAESRVADIFAAADGDLADVDLAEGDLAEGDLAEGDDPSGSSETVFELAVAAAQLDLMLAELPRSRQVIRLGTAGTIIGLEDQVRLINSEIRRADAEAAPLEYRAALMQDRVDVLNALYYVRYAQSRVF